ncbi:MAG: hypothetical protein WAL72_35700 [Streptosporangiaceae bacterium]
MPGAGGEFPGKIEQHDQGMMTFSDPAWCAERGLDPLAEAPRGAPLICRGQAASLTPMAGCIC